MSKIKELKSNPENCFNLVDAIQLFSPEGKTKYTEMLLRIMSSTPNLKDHSNEIIEHLVNTFDFIDKTELKKLSPMQLLLLYKFIETYFETNDLINFRKFCDYNERNLIEQNDLSRYKTFEDITTQVNVADIKVENKELEKEVVKVYEDSEWLLVRPLTFLASKKYGSNTKWCTTSESNPEYFLKYAERGVLIYCMNKKTGYKVASFYSLKPTDPEFSFWNQKDTKIESMDSELTVELLKVIRDVSKSDDAVSNRRLMDTVQIERENKNLRKWMSIDSITSIVREYSAPTNRTTGSITTKLSHRIQNALRREEVEYENEMATRPHPEPIYEIGTDDEEVTERPVMERGYDMGGVTESPMRF